MRKDDPGKTITVSTPAWKALKQKALTEEVTLRSLIDKMMKVAKPAEAAP